MTVYHVAYAVIGFIVMICGIAAFKRSEPDALEDMMIDGCTRAMERDDAN